MLHIRAPVAALAAYGDTSSGCGCGAPGGPRLQLIDTPGPNEAGEAALRHQVERLLDGVGAVIYLLDYTKLKTAEEEALFERLRATNPALVARLAQRLFFVVNKVDAAEVSDGQGAAETREYVAQLVSRQLGAAMLPAVGGGEGGGFFRLRPEQVLLLSARNALLARLVLSGAADPDARARFAQLAFGRFCKPDRIPSEQMAEAAHEVLAESGILELEAQVIDCVSL
jgi:hypothetical protein